MRQISHDIRSAVAQGAPLNPGPAEQLLLAYDEAIQERDKCRQQIEAITAAREEAWRQMLKAIEERASLSADRDEAQQAAWELMQWAPKNIRQELRERCDWLKEEPVSQGPPSGEPG